MGCDLSMPMPRHPILLLACGALARDVIALRDTHRWSVDILCVPALLHNTPHRIAPAVEARITALREQYERIIVVYGDCGTSGALDVALDRLGVDRISGPHCFEQFGGSVHDQALESEPGTFFLTDFLVRSFDALVWHNLGLDRHPELLGDYFAHYQQVVYLAQTPSETLRVQAARCAERLGLPLIVKEVGYGDLEIRLLNLLASPVANPVAAADNT